MGRRILVGVGSLAALLLMLAGYLLFADKFTEVGQSDVYRSAQLTAEDLEAYIHDRDIVAVLNLRGPNPAHGWYREQQAVLQRLGIRSRDLPLNARELPDFALLQRLVQALKELPRPLLVHCQHGNDRSGLVAAVVRLMSPNGSLAKAWDEVSLWRGVLYPDSVGKQFLAQYQAWLESRHAAHEPALFQRFVKQGYRDADGNLRLVVERIGEHRIRERDETQVTVAADAPFEIRGWAFDPLTRKPLRQIDVRLDGRYLGTAEIGLPRPDVAAALDAPWALQSGWRLRLPGGLERGCGKVSLQLTRDDGVRVNSSPQAELCIE